MVEPDLGAGSRMEGKKGLNKSWGKKLFGLEFH
jgi:hypothetical protein